MNVLRLCQAVAANLRGGVNTAPEVILQGHEARAEASMMAGAPGWYDKWHAFQSERVPVSKINDQLVPSQRSLRDGPMLFLA